MVNSVYSAVLKNTALLGQFSVKERSALKKLSDSLETWVGISHDLWLAASLLTALTSPTWAKKPESHSDLSPAGLTK